MKIQITGTIEGSPLAIDPEYIQRELQAFAEKEFCNCTINIETKQINNGSTTDSY